MNDQLKTKKYDASNALKNSF